MNQAATLDPRTADPLDRFWGDDLATADPAIAAARTIVAATTPKIRFEV